jgi:hypothetical protein
LAFVRNPTAAIAATTPIRPHSTNGKTSDTGDQPTLEMVAAR